MFNDCSPDDSQSIIDEYAQRYPDIVRPMRSEKNLGVGRARTEMCKQARGRYILSFDQDDIMLPFDLASVIAMMDAHPNYSASYARKFLFNDNGLTGEVHGGEYSEFNAFFTPKININAMVIRAEALAAHNYFEPVANSGINDDVYLMMRLAADTDIHYDADTPRTLYRVHDKQNSRLLDAAAQEPFRWMGEQMIKLNPELYQSVLNLNPPPLTPENRHLVLGYLGLAMFLEQSNKVLATRLVEKALQIAPDDLGAWEHKIYFSYLRNDVQFIEDVYRSALGCLPYTLPVRCMMFNMKLVALRNMGLEPSQDLQREWSNMYHEYWKPPKIVLDNLPKPGQKTQPQK